MNNLELKRFRTEMNLSQEDLAKIVGKTIRAVQSWEQGVRRIPESAILLMRNYAQSGNVNENLIQKESLLKQGIGATDKSKPLDSVTPVPNENYMWVEYADLSAAAGQLGGSDVDTLPETKKRLVPREYENGEYLVIRVDGDSMDDGSKYSIPDGTEILIKKYYLGNGDKLPIRNNLFVINAREGKALKQIVEHNVEDGYIVCHSYNSDFKDYKINMEDILEIFIYRKIVSSRPPIPDIN